MIAEKFWSTESKAEIDCNENDEPERVWVGQSGLIIIYPLPAIKLEGPGHTYHSSCSVHFCTVHE